MNDAYHLSDEVVKAQLFDFNVRVHLYAREIIRLRTAIRKHRDQRGDDRCWKDNEELYQCLPEGYTPPERDTAVELELCKRYIASCHDPRTQYVSPQRRIEELEQQVKELGGQTEMIHIKFLIWSQPTMSSIQVGSVLSYTAPAKGESVMIGDKIYEVLARDWKLADNDLSCNCFVKEVYSGLPTKT